jgi:hypothetical protein
LAAIVVFLMVTLLSVAGCITNTSTPSPTPSISPITGSKTLAAENLAGAIDDLYKSKNYTVNTPFTMTKAGDTITYKGVVTDGPGVLVPFKRTVTVVLTPTRDNAKAVYQTAVNTQKTRGYQEYLSSNSAQSTFWVGYLGTKYPSNPSTPNVRIDLHEPWGFGLILGGKNFENLYDADVSSYYQVLTDECQ